MTFGAYVPERHLELKASASQVDLDSWDIVLSPLTTDTF